MREWEHLLKILLKRDGLYLIQLFRTKDFYITLLLESSQPLVAESTCSIGLFLHFQDQMHTPHSLWTTSFSHGITAILESPVFCNLVAKMRYWSYNKEIKYALQFSEDRLSFTQLSLLFLATNCKISTCHINNMVRGTTVFVVIFCNKIYLKSSKCNYFGDQSIDNIELFCSLKMEN